MTDHLVSCENAGMTTPQTAGWYPDPTSPGIQRYWDGEEWSEHRAPSGKEGMAPGMQVVTIAAGILVALVIVWIVYALIHANDDTDCSIDNLNRSANGQPLRDCDQ